MDYEVTISHESGRHLAVVRFDARPEEMAEQHGRAFGAVAAYLARAGVTVSGPAMSRYEMGENGVFHVASGFVVPGPFEGEGEVVHLQLPETDVAMTTHLGPYDSLGEAYDALRRQARTLGREVDEEGPMWEEYWTGPEAPPEQTRTVVSWPVKPLEPLQPLDQPVGLEG